MARWEESYYAKGGFWKCDHCGRIFPTKLATERHEASHYVAEEMRTGKYPARQAVAIGLSRARAAGLKVGKRCSFCQSPDHTRRDCPLVKKYPYGS